MSKIYWTMQIPSEDLILPIDFSQVKSDVNILYGREHFIRITKKYLIGKCVFVEEKSKASVIKIDRAEYHLQTKETYKLVPYGVYHHRKGVAFEFVIKGFDLVKNS
jgi:hypothetical protein